VTASLHVDYLRPTPINTVLELRAKVEELKGRKVTITCDLLANDLVCAKGRVVVVEIPEHLMEAVKNN
jgi:acyl-CoA thioesterase FadM